MESMYHFKKKIKKKHEIIGACLHTFLVEHEKNVSSKSVVTPSQQRGKDKTPQKSSTPKTPETSSIKKGQTSTLPAKSPGSAEREYLGLRSHKMVTYKHYRKTVVLFNALIINTSAYNILQMSILNHNTLHIQINISLYFIEYI